MKKENNMLAQNLSFITQMPGLGLLVRAMWYQPILMGKQYKHFWTLVLKFPSSVRDMPEGEDSRSILLRNW